REYTFPSHEVTFTVLADRRKFPPRGLFGGHDGRTARYTLIAPDGTETSLGSKTTFRVPAGAVVRYETCGGGGYGNPFDRDPTLVQEDVREGKVSAARAASEYGIALKRESLDIDQVGTDRLRRRAGAA
ncbi:MAG: hydantoinase B/oxoprolinase family protein, partial [Roseiarcus sp.]